LLLSNPLNGIFGQVSKVKILRFLVNSQAQLNGREIAKNTGLSHVNAHAALKDLSRQGLVNMRSLGNSLVYWLNEEHFLVKDILRPVFEKEAGVFQRVIKIILSKNKRPLPVSIILFGSFASNKALPDSDIDIAVIYPDSKNNSLIADELAEAEKEITRQFGNRLAAIPIKAREFRKGLKKRDKFITEVIKTGRSAYGKSIAELSTVNG
jgi:predicted nucleotidyltransferase